MDHYYGVVRSDSNTLSHYGVKGMRWGVRKAIEKGNTKRLDKHYRMASKKLEKLNDKANIAKQIERANKFDKSSKVYRKMGRIGLGAFSLGYGSGLGSISWVNRKHAPLDKAVDYLTQIKGNDEYVLNKINELNDRYADYTKMQGKFMRGFASPVAAAGAGLAIGSYGGAALHKAIANKARKRATIEGHKKALSERNAWRNQMNEVFAGTKYDPKKKNKKKRRSHNG